MGLKYLMYDKEAFEKAEGMELNSQNLEKCFHRYKYVKEITEAEFLENKKRGYRFQLAVEQNDEPENP